MSKSSKATDSQGWPRHGDLKSTHVFRMLNFELYAKPNKIIMGAGLACLACSVAYIVYMRRASNTKRDPSVLLDDYSEASKRKVSNWDT